MRMVKRTALAGCFDHNDDNNAGFMKSKSTLAGCSFSMVLDSAPRSWHLSCGHSLKRENFRSYGTNGIQTEAIWKLWEWFSYLRDDLGGATGPDPGISTWQNQLNKGPARAFKKDKKKVQETHPSCSLCGRRQRRQRFPHMARPLWMLVVPGNDDD